MEYRSVSTHTLAGQAEAARLHAAGWEAYRTGLFMIYFRRKRGGGNVN